MLTRTEYDEHCTILGVSPIEGESGIRKAWRALAQKLHPDKGGGDEGEFQRVGSSYRALEEANFIRPPLPQRYQHPRQSGGDFGGLYTHHAGIHVDYHLELCLSDIVTGSTQELSVPKWVPCRASPPHTTCCQGLLQVQTTQQETVRISIPPGVGFQGVTKLKVNGIHPLQPIYVGVSWNHEVHPTDSVRPSIGWLSGIYVAADTLEIQFRITLDITEALLGGPLDVRTPWGTGTCTLPTPDVLYTHRLGVLPLPLVGLHGIPAIRNPGCLALITITVGDWTDPDQRALLSQLRDLRLGLAPATEAWSYGEPTSDAPESAGPLSPVPVPPEEHPEEPPEPSEDPS